MLRIAERDRARSARAQALVTGDVVGQVASQTLENLAVIGTVATLPVFRPLIGMDKDEITAEAQRLGTLSDLDHSRPGLLHAVHAAQSRDARAAATRSRRRSRRCRSTSLSTAPSQTPSWRTSTFPVREDREPQVRSRRGDERGIAQCRSAGLDSIEAILGDDAARCCSTSARRFRRRACTCPVPTSSIASTRCPTDRRAVLAQPAVAVRHRPPRRAPATCRSCRSIRASSIRRARRSRRTRVLRSENIVKLAIEGGCNAVASTLGVLGIGARASTRTRFRSS